MIKIKELIHEFQLKFKPAFEVESEKYYGEFLKAEDAIKLRLFVHDLGNKLSAIYVPSAILAVGSSTFPKAHWEYRAGINKKDPQAKASESYDDIDLVIVPNGITLLNTLEKSVQGTLDSLGFQWEASENSINGAHYGKQEAGYISWLSIDYGNHSISTELNNGTKLDLILGRDDLLQKTAAQKIAEERKEKYSFSLLYNAEEKLSLSKRENLKDFRVLNQAQGVISDYKKEKK